MAIHKAKLLVNLFLCQLVNNNPMPQLLQKRIVKSKATLPLVIILALTLWCLRIPFPLDEHILFNGWWGTVSFPLWLVQGGCLSLCALTSYLLAELNTTYSIVGNRTTLHVVLYLLLWSSFPPVSHHLESNLIILILVWATHLLYHSFQQPEAVGNIFMLFLSIGVGSFIYSPLWLFSLFFFLVLWTLQALSLRTFFAGLIGLICPYWMLFGLTLLTDKAEIFYASIHSLPIPFELHSFAFPKGAWIMVAYIGIIILCSLIYIWVHNSRYKIRTRLLLGAQQWWVAGFITLWLVCPNGHTMWLLPIFSCIGMLAGHMFSHSSTRLSNISFIGVIVLLVLMSVYSNVWMHW